MVSGLVVVEIGKPFKEVLFVVVRNEKAQDLVNDLFTKSSCSSVVASVDICSLSHNGVSRDHFKCSHEIAYIQLFILFDYTQMPITYPTTLLARDWIQ